MADETVGQAGSHERLTPPATTAELLRRVADHVEHPTPESLNVDVAHLFEWASDLERRVGRIEAFTDMILHIRDDVAAIAEGLDPTLGQRVAHHDTAIDSLTDAIEQHRLLLARLLEKETGQ